MYKLGLQNLVKMFSGHHFYKKKVQIISSQFIYLLIARTKFSTLLKVLFQKPEI